MSLQTVWNASSLDIVGRPADRRGALEKVTGRARYTFDVALPGMFYAEIVPSTIARGRVVSIDASRALRIPGVVHVATPDNFPRYRPDPALLGRSAIDHAIRFVGEEIGAVVATSEQAAILGRRALEIEYQVAPAVFDPEQALDDAAVKLQPAGNLAGSRPTIYARGDVAAAFPIAAVLLERKYFTSTQHHNPLEPHCCVAVWDEDELTIFDSNQGIHGVRERLTRALGIPASKVRVINHVVGGGFGSKNGMKPYQFIAACLARELRRPVRVCTSRSDEFIATRHRAETRRIYVGAVSPAGTLVALEQRVIGQAGPDQMYAIQAAGAGCSARLYACPNLRYEVRAALTNTQNPISFRGPTVAEDLFCFEQFIDELAHESQLDPLEFRLRNYAERDPVSGKPYTSKALRECYLEGAKRFGWHWSPPRRPNGNRTARGVGMSSICYDTFVGEEAEALVTLTADGAEVLLGVSEIGCGNDTVFAQIAAEELDLPFDRVRVVLGDTRGTPWSISSSFHSRTLSLVGPAVRAAAADARERLRRARASQPTQPIQPSVTGIGRRTLGADGYEIMMFGAHFVEVEVDLVIGRVRVVRAVCAHDAGRIVNPKLAGSQIHGGFLQGLGMALSEERILDPRSGTMLNNTMLSYFTPTVLDAPDRIDAVTVEQEDRSNLVGTKGLGEPPLIGAGAAIANAVYNAIGVRIRHYPLTPDKILTALEEP